MIQMPGHQQYVAEQTPGAKYNPEYGLTRPKVFQVNIRADPDAGKDKYKIVKSKDPDMGAYNALDCYKKTQLNSSMQKVIVAKSPKKNYLDFATNSKKGVPAPGTYNPEKSYARLSTSPPQIRTRRH